MNRKKTSEMIQNAVMNLIANNCPFALTSYVFSKKDGQFELSTRANDAKAFRLVKEAFDNYSSGKNPFKVMAYLNDANEFQTYAQVTCDFDNSCPNCGVTEYGDWCEDCWFNSASGEFDRPDDDNANNIEQL